MIQESTDSGVLIRTLEEAYNQQKRSVSWDEFLEKDPTASDWITNYHKSPILFNDPGILNGEITLDRVSILNWNNDVVNGVIKEQTYPDGKILKHEAGHWLSRFHNFNVTRQTSESAATKIENTFDNDPNTQTNVSQTPN